MGRPPIGKRAMTAAERQRRRRRLFRDAHPVTKQERATRSAIARATAPLQARIRELEGEIARLHCVYVDEAEALRRQVAAATRPGVRLTCMPPTRYRGTPMTLGNMRANGVRSLSVSCWIFHHKAVLPAVACEFGERNEQIFTDLLKGITAPRAA